MRKILASIAILVTITGGAFAECLVFENKSGDVVSFEESWNEPTFNGVESVTGSTGTGIMVRIAHVGDDIIDYFWTKTKLAADDPEIRILIWDDEAYFPACP